MTQAEFIAAMRQECPTIYLSLAQRHLDWILECDKARAFLSVVAESLEEHAMEALPMYAYPEVRRAWSRLTEAQRQFFDPGYLTRLIFEPRGGTDRRKQNNLLSLRKIIEDHVGKNRTRS